MSRRFLPLAIACLTALWAMAAAAVGADTIGAVSRQIIVSAAGQGQFQLNALFFNNRAYVPVRPMAEQLGYRVGWEGDLWMVTLEPVRNQSAPALDPGRWAPATRAAVSRLIDGNGVKSKGYDPQRRPYAVFDWDNTAIVNDTEEALYTYQIDNLAFKMTPDEFRKVLSHNVPPGPFAGAYKNAAGTVITLEAMVADLHRDYQYLYNHFKGMQGSLSLEEIRATPEFLDFKAKMLLLYEAINETHGAQVGYPWVLYFFANMTVPEVQKLAELSNDANLGAGLAKLKVKSPESLAGEAGVVEASYASGLRLSTEIANLMNSMRANGIDVYVVTASYEEVVRVFATHPKYGYGVKPENVIGMRLTLKEGLIQPDPMGDWPLTVYHGKTEAITRELAAQRGAGPIFVAGDSSGDYEMMTEFPDTQLVLVVNRLKTGNIGKLAAKAAEQMGAGDPKVVMQGRDENTGLWIPSEQTIKLGKSQPALLP